MIPLQGIILVSAVIAGSIAEERSQIESSPTSNKRKARGVDSLIPVNDFTYDATSSAYLNSYLTGGVHLNNYHNLDSGLLLPGYENVPNTGYPDLSHLAGAYPYLGDSVKRYAVKEDVDEGYVTTARPVYLPRLPPRSRTTPSDSWTPIAPDVPRAASGKAIFVPNLQSQYVSNSPQSVKTNYVHVEKVVGVPVPEPYSVPVYQPFPLAVPQPYPVQVPVPVEVHSTVNVAVEKPVHVPVVKHVPYNVIKNEPVPVPLPYPVPVPVYKTKYVVHSKNK